MEIGIVNHSGTADLLAIHKFKHRCEGFHAIEHALCRLSGNGNTLLAHFVNTADISVSCIFLLIFFQILYSAGGYSDDYSDGCSDGF